MFKKLIVILIIFGFLLLGFVYAQVPIEAPGTIEEAKEITHEAIDVAEKELPGILERIWREEVIPVWKNMWEWFRNVWNTHIWPRTEALWQKIQEILGKEIEKRKPIIEEEFEKEKEEIKQELPETGKSLWERFKELIK